MQINKLCIIYKFDNVVYEKIIYNNTIVNQSDHITNKRSGHITKDTN